MTCEQGLLRLLWGGPKLECYGTAISDKFFKLRGKRIRLLKTIVQNEKDNRISKQHLVSLCNTKFVERYAAMQTFGSILLFIVDLLQKMTQWQSLDTQKTALTLLNAIA